MRLKVSVIVPAACTRSLFEQSLPADEYEVLFIGEGRTHLDEVFAARGDYVYFLEADDRLAPDALERMVQAAEAADSDVLVARVDAPGTYDIFHCDEPRADVVLDGLMGHLGPQLLFRRAFLRVLMGQSVRPALDEGFVLRAYLTAKVVTVLGGAVCCHVGDRTGRDPDVRALLEVIDAVTEAGSQRDRLHAYWLARELRAGTAGGFHGFSADAERYLSAPLRARTELLRAGRRTDLKRLDEAERGVRAGSRIEEVRWDESVLVLELAAELSSADGAPLFLREEGGRRHWTPPGPPISLSPHVTDVTEDMDPVAFDVFVRPPEGAADGADDHFVPVTCRAVRQETPYGVRMWVTGQARIDVGSAAHGSPLDIGVWELWIRVTGNGMSAVAPLGGQRSPQADRACAGMLAGFPRRLVVPFWAAGGLCLRVQPASLAETVTLASETAEVARSAGHLIVGLPVPYVPPSGGPPTELVLRNRDREVTVPAMIEPGIPGRLPGQLVAKVPARRLPSPGYVGRGAWAIALRTDKGETPIDVRLEVGVTGRAQITRDASSPGRRVPHQAARW